MVDSHYDRQYRHWLTAMYVFQGLYHMSFMIVYYHICTCIMTVIFGDYNGRIGKKGDCDVPDILRRSPLTL